MTFTRRVFDIYTALLHQGVHKRSPAMGKMHVYTTKEEEAFSFCGDTDFCVPQNRRSLVLISAVSFQCIARDRALYCWSGFVLHSYESCDTIPRQEGRKPPPSPQAISLTPRPTGCQLVVCCTCIFGSTDHNLYICRSRRTFIRRILLSALQNGFQNVMSQEIHSKFASAPIFPSCSSLQFGHQAAPHRMQCWACTRWRSPLARS